MEERGRGAEEVKPVLEERIDKGHRILAQRVGQLQHFLSQGGVRLRVGRCLLYSGEEGVDASDHSLVCHLLDGPPGEQFDAVIAVGDYVVSGANHW